MARDQRKTVRESNLSDADKERFIKMIDLADSLESREDPKAKTFRDAAAAFEAVGDKESAARAREQVAKLSNPEFEGTAEELFDAIRELDFDPFYIMAMGLKRVVNNKRDSEMRKAEK